MDQRPFTSASFYQYIQEGRLMASRCQGCGKLHLPPRSLCDRCRSERMEWTALGGKGKLAAFTAIAVGPSFMVQEGYDRNKPYCAGIVELEEGPRISARILGVDSAHPETIPIGAPTTLEFLRDEHGSIKPVVAFKL